MSETTLTAKIYHVMITTPFGTHSFKIVANTQHSAAEAAHRTALAADSRLTRDHLTLHHMGSEEIDNERAALLKIAKDKGLAVTAMDIVGTPGNLTIDGMIATEWLELM